MPIELPRRRMPSEHMPGKEAVRLVTSFEGLSMRAYPDPGSPLAKTGQGSGDPWTIGYGHTQGVKEGDTCTLAQADEWLAQDLERAAQIIRDQITVPLTVGEFSALCSMVFNLGYIPRSLKAALNGGVSDKGEVFQPGSYGSALKQFPRNCRAAGVPMRGLLRRRLAEACTYSDLPFENACSINLVRLSVKPDNSIDPVETTSLEDTLQRARQDLPILRPDTSAILNKPWDELVLDKPVPPPAPTAKPDTGTAPAKASQPEPVQLPLPNTGSSKPASPGSTPLDPLPPKAPKEVAPASTLPPPKVPLPPVPAPPPPSDALPADLADPKDMVMSRRFWGLFLTGVSTINFLPRGVQEWLSNTGNRELLSWLVLVLVGVVLYQWGKKKAKRPLK